MRDDLDVSAYTASRWPALVRVLALMGVPAHARRGRGGAGLRSLRSHPPTR